MAASASEHTGGWEPVPNGAASSAGTELTDATAVRLNGHASTRNGETAAAENREGSAGQGAGAACNGTRTSNGVAAAHQRASAHDAPEGANGNTDATAASSKQSTQRANQQADNPEPAPAAIPRSAPGPGSAAGSGQGEAARKLPGSASMAAQRRMLAAASATEFEAMRDEVMTQRFLALLKTMHLSTACSDRVRRRLCELPLFSDGVPDASPMVIYFFFCLLVNDMSSVF